MTTAAVVYRSHTGTTRALAQAIGEHLRAGGIETTVASIGECDPATLAGVDFVLLGCWTSGLFVIRQHPDQPWVEFARTVPALTGPRVGLFTTYKLATGSMFAKMRAVLGSRVPAIALELKSKDGRLTDAHRRALDAFVNESAEEALAVVAALEGVMKRNPQHPGANHYYIHAVEASKTPARAAEASAVAVPPGRSPHRQCRRCTRPASSARGESGRRRSPRR